MSNKIGFWSVFALVTGSQIGTGVFMFPANLAPYGLYGLSGWLISGCGAIMLSLVFAALCSKFPQTGGPHVYVAKAFGREAAFFVGWTYWVISWVSTTAVIVTAVGYATSFLPELSGLSYLVIEILLLLAITSLNIKGIRSAGKAEIFLTFLKFAPLLIMSLFALRFFDIENFSVSKEVTQMPVSQILGKVTLLSLWGFIGLESATTTAGSVNNPSKTIPRAIIFGTLCVALLYFVNSVSIMGLIPGAALSSSVAPYVDAAYIIFGGRWHVAVSLLAAIVCIGTLNAWVLASGQIVLGLAEDGLMPKFFAVKNSKDSPVNGLIVSSLGIIPLLFLTADKNIATQITTIIDFSVIAFLFVYLLCSLGLLKILLLQQPSFSRFASMLVACAASLFCLWVIYETQIYTLLVAFMFVVSGLPVYLFWYCKKVKN